MSNEAGEKEITPLGFFKNDKGWFGVDNSGLVNMTFPLKKVKQHR